MRFLVNTARISTFGVYKAAALPGVFEEPRWMETVMKDRDKFKPLALYSAASQRAAAQIIGVYSTSFGLACSLLGSRHRQHVRNIYALVRIADELVDGVAAEAGLTPEMQTQALNALELETEQAMRMGYSSNPIVHAFALTARRSGIETELTRPFFNSMRMDIEAEQLLRRTEAEVPLSVFRFEDAALSDYVYGSAEVVGLMCLRVFIHEEQVSEENNRIMERGARSLGAAFQNINFLRDLADDTGRLGRSYLSPDGEMNAARQEQWIATIRQQLSVAAEALPLLPADARVAVACALRLFTGLTDRLENTPTKALYEQRVRVSAPAKTWLIAQSFFELGKARIK